MVKSCQIQKSVSKKGNDYFYIEIELINGYKMKIFPSYSDSFIIQSIYKENIQGKE